jgi:hypothetical protein
MEKIIYAKRNKDTVMSFVTDGMDQKHSVSPYLGTQHSFTDPLKAHIQGFLVHGRGNR